MPTRMPSPADSSSESDSWVPRHREALMLSNLLRVSRLTLLYGDEGAGKSSLLRNELMGLLNRRASDAPARGAAKAGVVVPFPDRRDGGRFSGCSEIALMFDQWTGDPLAGLHAALDQALGLSSEDNSEETSRPTLAERLIAAGRERNTRFLVILDGFEAHLSADPDADNGAQQRFTAELAQLLNDPSTPAHVFIVVRDASRPLLEPWRIRVPNFGDRWLRIRHWNPEVPLPGSAAHAALEQRETDEGPAAGGSRTRRLSSLHAVPRALTSEVEARQVGIDLYLPLERAGPPTPSPRVQALWDELLQQPSAARPAAAVQAGPAALASKPTARPAEAEARSDAETLKPEDTEGADSAATSLPPEDNDDEAGGPPLPVPPQSWRTPWRVWSLLVIAVAALMIFAWGESLRGPGSTERAKPIASGVEPARNLNVQPQR